MILRRIIAHFRKQEWTAIGIDFVIVVVGVLVGLQSMTGPRGKLMRVAGKLMCSGSSPTSRAT